MTPSPAARTLVVAVDGVLAETLRDRLATLLGAAETVGLLSAAPLLPDDWMAGLGWSEAVRALPGAAEDETLRDLAALAAERSWTRRMAGGLPAVNPEALAACRAAVAAGWRLILRADGSRRSDGALFEVLEEETGAVRTIAADHPDIRAHDSVITGQYQVVTRSLSGQNAEITTSSQRRVVEVNRHVLTRAGMEHLWTFGWPDTASTPAIPPRY